MSRARALIIAGHPGPSLAITALVTLLAAQAAPNGIGPVLTGPAMLAGQLSIGWSNDASDAAGDAAAGRTDKPVAT
ncbi:ubiquinone biosynthesis protein UbiA, partial [Mycobacterium sp. ITM-2017-0098]